MWHGGATWGNNNNNDDEDDDVEFQDNTTTQKRKSHEIIEIPDSSDENASSSEDEDVRQAEVKPSPAKKPKRKVSLPKCAATKAPTNLPPRVDCVAPPNLMLPRAGPCLILPEDRTTGDALMWPSSTPTPYLGGGIYEPPTPRGVKPIKKARKVTSRIARLLGTKSFDVRVDDGASLKRCTDAWRPYGKYGTLDGATCLDSLLKSNVVVAHDEAADFVEALAGLNDRDNDFKERCVHAVAFIESKQLASACTGGRKKSCRVHVAVWARRALFGLSAHPSTKIVLDGIDPAGKRHPCRAPLAEDGTFSRSDPPLSSFTIKALLRDAESSGIAVPKAFAKSMDGLLADGIQLRPYQMQNVFWAQHQEDRKHTATTSVAGLNGYYWERRAFVDGGDFYYFPHGGHVLLEPPPVVSGGLLADEMGYGKTITALALIAADKKKYKRPAHEAGTLVVVPRSLYGQWKAECETKAPGLKTLALDASGYISLDHVREADVVLLRQDQLSQFRTKVSWRRVVVDECQFVANDTSRLASATAGLDATHVWMLSGTPITTKIADLQGELSLLRVWPFTLGKGADAGWQSHFWEASCREPWANKDAACLATFRSLIKGTMMRHAREQRTVCDDQPLVPLPPLTTRWVGVDLAPNASETYVARRIELYAAETPHHLLVRALQRASTFCTDDVLDSLYKNAFDAGKGTTTTAQTQDVSGGVTRELSLADAVRELETSKKGGTNAIPCLAEFRRALKGEALDTCDVCQSVKRSPLVLKCQHSFCTQCVRALGSSMKCAVCNEQSQPHECYKLLMPKEQARRDAPIAMDADGGEPGSAVLTLGRTRLTHTVADLDAWPAIDTLPARDPKEPEYEALAGLPRALRQHHARAQKQGWRGSAKLSAVAGEIRRLKDADVTTQFVVVSQYGDLLDELQEAFDPVACSVKYEVDLDLANRDGKKLPEGSRVEYRKEAYDPLTAVDGVIVKVDEKKECKACGRQFLIPFPDICPDCYVECKPCPAEQCGWTCKPCVGVLKTGEPCTRDENCDKCKGKYGCGRVYGPGTEPAPYVYSGPTNPKKDTRDFELKKLDGQIICTDPRCTALRKVKQGKKFVDRPNETPLTACDGCGGKYGCGAKYNAQTCPKPTDKDGNIDEEKGSMKCTSPACRKLRFCRPARTGRNPRPEQKPNDSALYKNTLRSLTKMECPNCHARHSPPYPEGRTAEGKKGLVCDKCGTKQKLKELTDVEAGLPKYLYTIAHGGEEAINVVKGQLTAKSHRCVVPGKMVRAASCKDKEGCLTRGGFDNRFTAGDKVTATRPALSMDEALEVGMRVKVLEGPYAGASGVVHKLIVETDDDVVAVDASKSRAPRDAAAALRVARFGGGGAAPTTTETKASTVKYEVKVRPKRGAEVKVTFERSALEDQKDGLWRPAKVVSVVKPAGCADAFEQTLGSIRLDDSSPDRRGQLLETFRSDPETSVLLLTLQTAGVGLNITNANKVIILEPFRFGAQEAQAVTRVHRIGQLRPVEIIKFYCRNSVDERMLRLRQKRGELDASQDGDAPSADDVGAGAGDTAFAKADLDVLFGVTE